MIEGPKAIYDRAKSIFFRSILDGIGKADAAAEYHFALLNLQRHDAIVPMDEVDTVLQKMIEPVLKQGEEEWEPFTTLSGQPMYRPQGSPDVLPIQSMEGAGAGPMEPLGAMRGEKGEMLQESQWISEEAGTGIYSVEEPEGFTLQPSPFAGRVKENELDDAGRIWPVVMPPDVAGFEEDASYHDHDPFSHHFDPLHMGYDYHNPPVDAHGRQMSPPWLQHIENYYLPSRPGEDSISDQEKSREAAWEAHHTSHSEHDNKLHPILEDKHLGQLGSDMHNHDLYLKRFDRWKADNPDKLQEVNGLEDPMADWLLQKAHFQDWAEEMLSNEYTETDEGRKHRTGIGDFDFHTGLYLLDPVSRTKIYDHLKEHNADTHTKNTNALFSMGRLKRNFWSRMGPRYDFWQRSPDMTGPNFSHLIEPKSKTQTIHKKPLGRMLAQNADIYHALLQHHSDMTGETVYGPQGGQLYNLPIYDRKENELRLRGRENKEVSWDEFHLLAGIDPKTKDYYPKGQHPVYGERWDPERAPLETYTPDNPDDEDNPFDANDKEYGKRQFQKVLDDSSALMEGQYAARDLRNAGAGYTNPWLHVPHHEKYAGMDGHSFSTYWHDLYKHMGGMGKHPHTLMELMHDSSIIGGDNAKSDSLFGVKTKYTPERLEERLDEPSGPLAHQSRLLTQPIKGDQTFDYHSDSKGLMAPFAPYSKQGYKETVELLRGKKQRVRRVKPGNEFSGWNVKYAPSYVGAKSDWTRNGSVLDGPLANKMALELDENYTDKHRRKKSKSAIQSGEYGGVPTYAKVDNPFTHRYNVFGPSKRIMESSGASHIPATQFGFTRHPMNPQAKSVLSHRDVDESHITTPSMSDFEELQGKLSPETHGAKKEMGVGVVGRGHDPKTGAPLPSKFRRQSDEAEGMNAEMDKLDNYIVHAEEGLRLARENGDHEKVRNIEDKLTEHNQAYNAIMSKWLDLESNAPHRMRLDMQNKYLDSRDEMHSSSMDTIADQMLDLRKLAEQEGHQVIDLDNPVQSMHNLMNFALHSNDYVNKNSHEVHGKTRMGIGERDVEVSAGAGADERGRIKDIVHQSPRLSYNSSNDEFLEALGLSGDDHDMNVVNNLRERLFTLGEGDFDKEFPIMSVSQLLNKTPVFGGPHHGDSANTFSIQNARRSGNNWRKGENIRPLLSSLGRLSQQLGGRTSLQDELGLHWFRGSNRHPEHKHDPHEPKPTQRGPEQVKYTKSSKEDINMWNRMQDLESILISNPDIEPHVVRSGTRKEHGPTTVPVGNAGTPHGNAIPSIHNSPGHRMNWGWGTYPTLDMTTGKGGEVKFHHYPHGTKRWLLPISRKMVAKVAPELLPHLGQEHPIAQEDMPAQLRANNFMRTPNRDLHSVSKMEYPILLASLTNPDVLIKEDAEKPPPLQPMHRIFEMDDLEHLKGFSGDWVVTLMPEGSRHFIRRKGDDITAWRALGGKTEVSAENIKSLKETTEKDFFIDTIYVGDECHVFDVLEYDEEDTHDLSSQDRMKILRGGMQSHEKVLLPGAYNTRLTDDGGLEATVEDLQKEGKRILLRDAESTYMLGEKRHPKWVLLQPGKEVVLMVLERRGEKPYSYRLGTGPITQKDSIGDRGVEIDGETYMDVGSVFQDDEKYDVGSQVEVNVDSVTGYEHEDEKIFNVYGSSIEGEAEGEPLVSRETLDIMTKSDPLQWPHQIARDEHSLIVKFREGDIIYRAYNKGDNWMIHSPKADNNWLIRLAESQRPFWAPVAGVLFKGNLDMVEEEKKEAVYESNDDGKPLIKPTKVKDTNYWDKVNDALKTIEKTMSGSPGHAWSGSRGLGIDMATPIESPSGPTSVRDQSGLPDYDARPRPEEDPEKPRKKTGEKPQSIDYPIESEGEQADLHVDDEAATLHMY